jgi:hypothetical protein
MSNQFALSQSQRKVLEAIAYNDEIYGMTDEEIETATNALIAAELVVLQQPYFLNDWMVLTPQLTTKGFRALA